jgi:hypothetical protein
LVTVFYNIQWFARAFVVGEVLVCLAVDRCQTTATLLWRLENECWKE